MDQKLKPHQYFSSSTGCLVVELVVGVMAGIALDRDSS